MRIENREDFADEVAEERMQGNWDKPIKCYCKNCTHLMVGYRAANGLAKLKCPRCGLVLVSKLKSRRCEQVEYYAPPGEIIE